MLLGFKRRFAPMVEDGSKTHTIRAKRKPTKLGYKRAIPRAGQTCHCYVDSRQKTMRLLGRWPCTRVEDIVIYERGDGSFGVKLGGAELGKDEKDWLAWRDGFRDGPVPESFDRMIAYWLATHKRSAPFVFEGDLIHWRYEAEARV